MTKSATLVSLYEELLEKNNFSYDKQQVQLLNRLQSLRLRLERQHRLSFWRQWFYGSRPVKGLYIWGGVGRGKTLLVDLFYDALDIKEKKRIHFHRFMYEVHEALKKCQGSKNPLASIAKQYASGTKLLCFDEFFVSDITDAMILGGLFTHLFERGVTLVATSNVEPANLYQNGLQRERFLPAIDLILAHCDIYHMRSDTDHRLRQLEQAALYYSPCDDLALDKLAHSFCDLAPEAGEFDVDIEVEGRTIPAKRLASDVVWFTFAALCDGPRGQRDYIELARLMHTVFISHIPQLLAGDEDKVRRFIGLVDEFYERNVKLILAADAKLTNLYIGEKLEFEFQRTVSRLTEMQSTDYLARPHRP